MSITKLNNLSISAVTALPSGVGGKVLQVVQTAKTDTFSTSTASYTDITGLSVSITPSSASNKVLILCQISAGGDDNLYSHARIVRGSTSIFEGNSDGASRTESTIALTATTHADKFVNGSIMYLDSPATTSATTYKLQVNSASSQNFYINRTHTDANQVYTSRPTSSITVMEIAG